MAKAKRNAQVIETQAAVESFPFPTTETHPEVIEAQPDITCAMLDASTFLGTEATQDVQALQATSEEATQPEPVSAQDVIAEAPAPAINTQSVDGAHSAILDAIGHRVRCAPNLNQARSLQSEVRMWRKDYVARLMALGVDIAKLAECIALTNVSGAKDARFVAVYALEKVRQCAAALTHASATHLDPYTHPILINARAGAGSLRNKAALVTLSRSIAFTETEQQQSIIARHRCAPSTASTQASSTRKALAALGAAEYDTADKVLRLRDNDVARALLALV